MKRNDSESTVAAAGFMLKQENMKARLKIALALIAMNAWDIM